MKSPMRTSLNIGRRFQSFCAIFDVMGRRASRQYDMAINHSLSCILRPQLSIIARTTVSSKSSASDVRPAGVAPS
eukprot:1858422-Pyramimonas_sp.AAC.1